MSLGLTQTVQPTLHPKRKIDFIINKPVTKHP